MSRIETVRAAMMQAMKDHDKERKEALSLLLSALKNKAIDKRADLTEDEENAVVLREIKQCQESIEQANGREDIIAENTLRMKVYQEFAPKMMSEDEVEAEVTAVLADALRVERTATGGLRIAGKMDTFIKLPEGETLPENIVSLTGITDERLQTEGVQPVKAAGQIAKLMQNGPTLMIAHNAQFDACFLRGLLRGQKVGRIDWLDSLTVYKDRRAYPHKLANAIIAYDLTGKVQNSHRAIDDVLALFEVLKAMDDEREDLGSYVNLFGYNPKYGVSGRRIVGVRYEPQSFSKGLTRPEQTLPARVARR